MGRGGAWVVGVVAGRVVGAPGACVAGREGATVGPGWAGRGGAAAGTETPGFSGTDPRLVDRAVVGGPAGVLLGGVPTGPFWGSDGPVASSLTTSS
ncbi:MAG: hypothetical protein AVDCRST_MAG76-868 [uncultured Acidimicrobiales bacterium]|uniref:Uncharacterized protein n=1 Tax=uncultured Acidimicrobiales bacterium TaxID=310071 RepID=A0A6J4HHM9_9ACTN|nr:MAG: hypothetical protein AVDCRST_MAG76-868 [uncultured Acidimicrobiales bacterium]